METLPTPKLLFSEKAYAAAVSAEYFDGRICFTCFKKTKVDKCKSCKLAWYCSKECQNRDWTVTGQHLRECKVFQAASATGGADLQILKGNEVLRLVARILARKRKDEGETWLKEDVYFPSEFQQIADNIQPRKLGDLMSNSGQISGETFQKGWMIFGKLFGSKTAFFAKTSLEDFREIFGIVQTNSFAIVNYDLFVGQKGLGTGLYLESSRFNHSCLPDLVRSLNGSVRCIKLLRNVDLSANIDKFNDLTVNYRHSFGSGISLTRERRKHLSDESFFVCNCDLCKDEKLDLIKEYSLQGKCPKDHESLVGIFGKDGSTLEVQCSDCNWTTIRDAPEVEAKVVKFLLDKLRNTFEGSGAGGRIEEDPFVFIEKTEKVLNGVKNIWVMRLKEEAMDQEWELYMYLKEKKCRDRLLGTGKSLLKSYRYYGVTSSFFPVLAAKLGRLAVENDCKTEARSLYEESKALWATVVCDQAHHTVAEIDKILEDLK